MARNILVRNLLWKRSDGCTGLLSQLCAVAGVCGGAAVMEQHLRPAGPFMVARTRNASRWDCRFLFSVPARLPDTQRLLLPSAPPSRCKDRVHICLSSPTPPPLILTVSSSIFNPPSIRSTGDAYISCPPARPLAHSHSCRPMSWFIYEL